jgi:Flp pilus assembly protein TadG
MRRNHRSRSKRGAMLIEFALSITILILTVFSMIEVMLMVYTYNVMADAAKEGVRYACVRGAYSALAIGPSAAPGGASSCTTNSGPVYTQVQKFTSMSLHDNSGITVTVCYLDGSNKPPSRVQVNINYPVVPYFALPWTPPTVVAQAQGNIVY